ncbi:phosphate-selective porin O and P [Anaeromyxobacter sp. K]|uniref:porin n=1 Tax=Anaeromyxobacter sp. (strain K) TaxID=447217 RepID=UPI00015F8258|nr:porin [Anaeromyxobacter sp. K]ACG73333.1 phosphate-selective porin O and P [Anaeromyxobacter sp. K]
MNARILIPALAAAVAVAVPAAAQQQAPEQPAASSAPAAEAPRPSAEAPKPAAKPASGPTFWGFLNIQYSRTDAPSPAKDTSSFELRRARIGARGDLLPQVGYAVLWDGADSSLKDAYGALKKLAWLPGLELRFGQWKTPFGYEQPESDTKLLWVNSSYAVASLARGPDSRDLGVGINGKWAVGGGVGVEVAASLVNGAGPNKKDDLDEKNVWARGGASAKLGPAALRVGGSYGYGHQVSSTGTNARFDGAGATNGGAVSATNDDTYFWFQTYGADVTLDSPWLFVAAELIQSERDLQVHAGTQAFTRRDVTARGWYAGLYGKSPWNVGPIFRAERYDRDRGTGDNLNERYTVGAYADIVPVNARLILNYEIDRSDRPVRTGNRAIAFAQLIF